jgi:Peptidase M50B-like
LTSSLRAHWQLVVIAILIYALWSTPVIYPLRIMIVFLHELSHGLAALLTGGSVDRLVISSDEGGLAYVRGGSRFAILTAGYLGSLLWGVLFFIVALQTDLDRWALALAGAGMLIVTALYLRDGFPLIFCTITGVTMLLTAWFLPVPVNDLMLRVIGISSLLYVPNDIISDTISRSHLQSDARMLAEEFGGATLLWGGIWLVISLGVIALVLRFALGDNSNIRLRPPRGQRETHDTG